MDKITTKIDLLDRIAEGIDWNNSLLHSCYGYEDRSKLIGIVEGLKQAKSIIEVLYEPAGELESVED